jgi:nicotinamide mononucleotide (NMN) deamidase PncC
MLRERHNTLSVAESCTGGLLGGRITPAPGAPLTFSAVSSLQPHEGGVAGRAGGNMAEFGAVSKETAGPMALGARRRTGSTYALAITGVEAARRSPWAGSMWAWRTRPDARCCPASFSGTARGFGSPHPDGAGYAAAEDCAIG